MPYALRKLRIFLPSCSVYWLDFGSPPMSVLLFRLNNVPEEEAEGVRAVLLENEIDFYETSAGAFGISVAAIWLRDESELTRAREVIAAFQIQHAQRVREEWQDSHNRGEADSFLKRLRREPLKVLLLIGGLLVVLYVSIVPWLSAWD